MAHDTRSRIQALISEQAAEWFIEFRTGDIDAAGRRGFDGWLRTSPEHLRAYVEVAAIWNESASLAAHKHLDTDELIALALSETSVVPWARPRAAQPDLAVAVREPPPFAASAPQANLWSRRLSLAAGLLVVLTSAASVGWYQLDRAPEYSTEVGEQRSLRLADGSTVELNSRSKLRVRFTRSQRVVELVEGQALFHVAKNPARPFIVHSAQASVRAVGTRFDVYKKTAGTVVTVIEGRVAVSGGGDSAANHSASPTDSKGSTSSPVGAAGAIDPGDVFLSAGEQLAVTPRSTTRPMRANVAAATAWTQRQLILDNAPLEQVAEEFNRYSARKLVAFDHGAPELRLSGVFTTDPEFLIRYLRERPDIVVNETSTEVSIVRLPQLVN